MGLEKEQAKMSTLFDVVGTAIQADKATWREEILRERKGATDYFCGDNLTTAKKQGLLYSYFSKMSAAMDSIMASTLTNVDRIIVVIANQFIVIFGVHRLPIFMGPFVPTFSQ
jgi:hypothetical protein